MPGSQNDAEQAIYLEYEGDESGNNVPDPDEIDIKPLKGDGDFRSPESIELLKQADIVVTRSGGYRRPGRSGRVLRARAGPVVLVVTNQDHGARASHTHRPPRRPALPRSPDARLMPLEFLAPAACY